MKRFLLMMFCVILMVGMVVFAEGEMRVSVPLNEYVILIDAGHGGQDPGMVVGSESEAKINLVVATKLKEKLEEYGFTVYMTRTEEKGLCKVEGEWNKDEDMNMRKEMISESGCNMFISVHQNSHSDISCKGAQVFYSDNLQGNGILADIMQKKLIEAAPFENKRTALINNDYKLLRGNTVPSVIIECGFMTNADELKILTDSSYQDILAEKISEGVLEYVKK